MLAVDQEKKRVALGLKQLTEDPWLRQIPEHYLPGQIVKGKVTKITNFGVFVELEPGLEGLLHISELADHKVENPQGRGQGRRGDRGEDPPRGHRRAEDRPVAEARPVGGAEGAPARAKKAARSRSAAAAAWRAGADY